MNVRDPFYSTAAQHFARLLKTYSGPIVVLDLVKQREKTPREMILFHEYSQAIDYLNQYLSSDDHLPVIEHVAFDMARAAKSQEIDVISELEALARQAVQRVGYFHADGQGRFRWQRGVIRTNCIDCLDRTNTAQFIIGKVALACQVASLVVSCTSANFAIAAP